VTSIILSDVQALHDTHVDGEQHRSLFTGFGVGTGAGSKYAGVGYQPIEVPYLRWLIGRARGKVMDEDAEWQQNPAWQRSRFSGPPRQSPPR
jgi:hypothetical protein